jgi:hypothetical protein
MLKKSFVFMMLLAASLIVISSAAHHQPEVAIAQPQAPQLQQPQLQSPNTAPNIIGNRPLPGSLEGPIKSLPWLKYNKTENW